MTSPHETPSAPRTGGAPSAPLEWQRLHPVTPFVRGWTVVAVALAFIGQQSLDQFNEAAQVAGAVSGLWWKVLLGLAALTTVAFGYAVLAWRMTAYAVGDDDVHMRRGVVFRQQRHARLDRLQAVDIRQPLLARLFGLAELILEVAGGSGSAIAIGFLREEEARRLRAELLARAAGVRARGAVAPPSASTLDVSEARDAGAAPTSDTATAPPSGTATAPVLSDAGAPAGAPASDSGGTVAEEAPEEEVYSVPPGRLLVSLLRSPGLWVLALAIIAVITMAIVTRSLGLIASALPLVLGGGGYLFNRFAGEFGFRAALSPDGIRLRHGLLETRAQTIPPGRVQAVALTQGPLWRGPDWWRVRVNVAGYQDSQGSDTQSVLLPVGPRAEALTALWLVLPDLGTADPLALLDEGLTGMVPAHDRSRPSDDVTPAFTNAPRRARLVDPLAWRRDAFAVTDRALLLRRGRLVRRLDVVPHERTQSLALEQGPLQRRLGLATFAVHSTPGPVSPSVPHLDAPDAARLLREQAARARAARAAAGPERWMEHPAAPRSAAAPGRPAEPGA